MIYARRRCCRAAFEFDAARLTRFLVFLTRWLRPDRILCLLRRPRLVGTAKASFETRSFVDLLAAAGISACTLPTFSITVRSVSASAFAQPCAIPRKTPVQMRAGCDETANHVFQGPRGLYISLSPKGLYINRETLFLWYRIKRHDRRHGDLQQQQVLALVQVRTEVPGELQRSTNLGRGISVAKHDGTRPASAR
jgi:hypothetical protein